MKKSCARRLGVLLLFAFWLDFQSSLRFVTRGCEPSIKYLSELWIREDAWTHCRNCCGDVRERMLKSSLRGLGKDVACFTFHPEASSPSSYTFVARRRQPLNRSYFKSALRFLRDVASEQRKNRGERSGVAIRLLWVIDDDASLPRKLQRELKSLNVFILAHSINANCFTDESVVLAPNFHFIKRDGFKLFLRNLREREIPFDERKSDVFWRGSTSGMSTKCEVEESTRVDGNERVTACVKLPRVRAVQSSINVPWLDVEITRRVQSCRGQTNVRISPRVSEQHWITHKGILEIDGNVDAWGNRWRMESGSVLFLVKSNFKHYYSDKLVDGIHYIGISGDLHDLVEKTKIITNTDGESLTKLRDITANARALMQEFTYERVVKGVSHRLNELALGMV